jgi:hypothetical protein
LELERIGCLISFQRSGAPSFVARNFTPQRNSFSGGLGKTTVSTTTHHPLETAIPTQLQVQGF